MALEELKGLSKDAIKKCQKDGIYQTARVSTRFVKRSVSSGFSPFHYQTDQRADLDQRWEIMRPHVSESDSNLLDIGCAEGALMERFANLGLFCIGMEASEVRVAQAQKLIDSNENAVVLNMTVGPNQIDNLPHFNIILLLTVYHHWIRNYGFDDAEDMLQTLVVKSDKLYFEPPGEKLNHPDFDDKNADSIAEYYKNYLLFVLGDEISIEHIGSSDYSGGERKDPIFLLEHS